MPFVSETVFHFFKTAMVLGISARKFGRCVKRSKEKHSSLQQSAMSLSSSSSQQHLPSPNCVYSNTTLLFCCLLFSSLHSPTASVICCYLLAVLVKALCWTTPSLHGRPQPSVPPPCCFEMAKNWNLDEANTKNASGMVDPEVKNISVRLCLVLAPRHIEHKWHSVTYQHWWSCLSWFSLPEKHQHHLI